MRIEERKVVKLSKRYQSAREIADLAKGYPVEEAVTILSRMPVAKFDETVELSVRLGVDPRQSNQMVRGVVSLPNGSGKKVRVLVFTENDEEALEAGADYAGLDDVVSKIQKGWLEFDVAMATPAAMKQVRAVARILGPRGLMPNPKSGTVTDDVAVEIKEIKQGGRVEYKMDKTANIGVVVGKRSFEPPKLEENIRVVIESIGRAKPESAKGRYILSMSISGTMTPAVRLDSGVYSGF